jgi:hypothetical protein
MANAPTTRPYRHICATAGRAEPRSVNDHSAGRSGVQALDRSTVPPPQRRPLETPYCTNVIGVSVGEGETQPALATMTSHQGRPAHNGTYALPARVDEGAHIAGYALAVSQLLVASGRVLRVESVCSEERIDGDRRG